MHGNQKTLASRNSKSHSRCYAEKRQDAVKKKTINRIMAEVRTLATAILNKTNCQNKKAQLENFSDDFDGLIITLKNLNFL